VRSGPVDDTADKAEPGDLRVTGSAGLFGNAVEWYDFAVLGASATLVADALTPGGSGGITAVFAIFAITLLVRPLGALLGALWADRAGRRLPLIVTVAAMSLATAAIALLPPWATAGGIVVVLLLLLRVVQGLATGAELVVSVAYLIEHAPPHRRGTWGGMHMATIAAGFVGGTFAVATASALLSADSLASWGWRVPFLLALPLGYAAVQLRRRVAETPDFRAMASRARDFGVDDVAGRLALDHEGADVWRHPWAALLPHRGRLFGGFALAAGLMSSFTLWFVFLPAFLAGRGLHPLPLTLACASGGLLAMSASAILSGRASDTWGRAPLIAMGAAVVSLTWLFGFPLVLDGSVTALVFTSLFAGAGLGGFVLQSALIEGLPARVRTATLAVTFGLASALVGGTAPLVADILARRDPALVSVYAVAWLFVAGVGLVTHRRTTPEGTGATPGVGGR
jgi:MFS transporter, MHS family, proline/betaine transporter